MVKKKPTVARLLALAKKRPKVHGASDGLARATGTWRAWYRGGWVAGSPSKGYRLVARRSDAKTYRSAAAVFEDYFLDHFYDTTQPHDVGGFLARLVKTGRGGAIEEVLTLRRIGCGVLFRCRQRAVLENVLGGEPMPKRGPCGCEAGDQCDVRDEQRYDREEYDERLLLRISMVAHGDDRLLESLRLRKLLSIAVAPDGADGADPAVSEADQGQRIVSARPYGGPGSGMAWVSRGSF